MESKINLAQVAPVNYKVTAALVNQFVVSTTQFLNRFVTRCDRKLHQVGAKMHRIEVRPPLSPRAGGGAAAHGRRIGSPLGAINGHSHCPPCAGAGSGGAAICACLPRH